MLYYTSFSFSIFLLFLILTTSNIEGRRRISQSNRAFEEKQTQFSFSSAPGTVAEADVVEKKEKEVYTSSSTKKILTTTTTTTQSPKNEETTAVEKSVEKDDEMISNLLNGLFNLENLTKLVEEEFAEATNATVLWIDTSYKALDYNLTIDEIEECILWKKYWNATEISQDESTNSSDEINLEELKLELKETEIVKTEKRLKKIGLNPQLLEIYSAIGLVYREICGNHGRTFWYRSREDASKIGVDSASPICEPFKEELNPDEKTLSKLALKLNLLIQNVTEGINPPLAKTQRPSSNETMETTTAEATTVTTTTNNENLIEVREIPIETSTFRNPITETVSSENEEMEKNSIEETTTQSEASNEVEVYDDDVWDYQDMHKRFKVKHKSVLDDEDGSDINSIGTINDLENELHPLHHHRHKRHHKKGVILKTRKMRKQRRRVKRDEAEDDKSIDSSEDDTEDDWLSVKQVIKTEDGETTVAIIEEQNHLLDGNMTDVRAWIEIDASDAINPTLLISSPEAISALGLEVDPLAFQRFENVGLYLPGICSEYVPKAIDEFNSSSFEGVEIEGPIGVNITALELAGVNLTALAEKLRNDTEVDEILSRTNGSTKNLGGSFILPVLNKNQYDPFSAPIVFQGSAVVVRFGIYIESMSNFQTSTMDYDMDIYLMMSWRDARLVNPYDKPILVKEEDILERIWRPDPFFANAKEAEFHEVTFLNFLMRIFPDGLVLYETRVKIKPSCNLILCKYPHDKQTCDLLIKSFAYPIETVRFEWFTHRKNAIDKNPDVKLPELYIDRYETTTCAHARKSGDFSCLRAVFRLKRDVGYHIAQTYIPTSLALMFSWVGVWLPEEFMEGRIGVAITVLLTLSTESAGAREHLPSVSYLKAIDLWFGFITGFVFFTLLQTLFVIGFDKRANQLRKWAGRKTSDITEEIREALLQKATRYHKTGRYLDNFCRVFYPLSFILFLFIYYFVFTEGRQDDCMNRR